MALDKDQVKSTLKNIPPLPPAVANALAVIQDDDVNYESIHIALSMDSYLTSQLLSLANSPFFSMAGKINNLKEACLVLGVNTVKNLVITAAVMTNLSPKKSNNLDFKSLWRHSLGVACVASILANKVGKDPDIAFTAGLLHDIGKMILDIHFTKEYAKVLEYSLQEDFLIEKAEKTLLGLTHAGIGAIVARKWNLPEVLSAVIDKHHSPEKSKYQDMTTIVNIADILARAMCIGNPGDDLIPELKQSRMDFLNLNMDIISNILPNVDASMRDIEHLIEKK